jgi:hypothetical protein
MAVGRAGGHRHGLAGSKGAKEEFLKFAPPLKCCSQFVFPSSFARPLRLALCFESISILLDSKSRLYRAIQLSSLSVVFSVADAEE